jgi:riboflavin synthase
LDRVALASQFKVDQSIAHNGVCLTVEALEDNLYKVTAVQETLDKTALHHWQPGTAINLERSLQLSSRWTGISYKAMWTLPAIANTLKTKKAVTSSLFHFPMLMPNY